MSTHESGLILPAHVELEHSIVREPLLHAGETVAGGMLIVGDLISPNRGAEVYRAKDADSGSPLALKVLREHTPDEAERVDRELIINRLLAHRPGVVALRGMGILEETEIPHRYLTTEFATGGSLLNQLESGKLNLAKTLRMAMEIVPAIEDIHAQGVIHRDIKPGNIMESRPGGEWMLGDFGIAQISYDVVTVNESPVAREVALQRLGSLSTSSSYASTVSRGLLGTQGYVAPEVFEAREDHINGHAADMFAFGVTVFKAATGEYPFKSRGSFEDYATSVTTEFPLSARSYNPALPIELSQLLRESMRHDPEDRPTFSAFRDTLLRIYQAADVEFDTSILWHNGNLPTTDLAVVDPSTQAIA